MSLVERMKAMKSAEPASRPKRVEMPAWQRREVYKEKQILAEEMAGLSPFEPGVVRGQLASVEHFSDGRSVAVVRDESSERFAVVEVEQEKLERLELGQAVELKREDGALEPVPKQRERSRGRDDDGWER
jgi:hypothetical protein